MSAAGSPTCPAARWPAAPARWCGRPRRAPVCGVVAGPRRSTTVPRTVRRGRAGDPNGPSGRRALPAAGARRGAAAAPGERPGERQHEGEADDVGDEARGEQQRAADEHEGGVRQLARRASARCAAPHERRQARRPPARTSQAPEQPTRRAAAHGLPAADRPADGHEDGDLHDRHARRAAPPAATSGGRHVAPPSGGRPADHAGHPRRCGRSRSARSWPAGAQTPTRSPAQRLAHDRAAHLALPRSRSTNVIGTSTTRSPRCDARARPGRSGSSSPASHVVQVQRAQRAGAGRPGSRRSCPGRARPARAGRRCSRRARAPCGAAAS